METEVRDWIKTFARPMRGRPDCFIVDEIDHEFYLVLDCEDGGTPESEGTCDVLVVSLRANDPLADCIRIRSDADQAAVVRLFDGLNIQRLTDHLKPIPRTVETHL